MHRIFLSLLACAAFGTFAISSAPASIRFANIATAAVATTAASNPRAPTKRSHRTSGGSAHALARAARKARKTSKVKSGIPSPTRVIMHKASSKNFADAQKAAQAESNARTERLYRASQYSAPIIIDAKACKRVGAHGESIYENC